MKGTLTILICILFCLAVNAKGQTSYSSFSTTTNTVFKELLDLENKGDSEVDLSKFETLIKTLENRRYRKKSDLKFLKSVFYTTHRQLLIKYDKLSNLGETLETGSYGCLSGTMTYALILAHFGFDYQILELPNHVFLQVRLKDQNVYFESTLPANGFITSKNEVYHSIKPYLNKPTSELIVVADKQVDNEEINLSALKINLVELGALQHFNEAIKDFHASNFEASIDHAVKAYSIYPSDRNLMLMQFILNKVRNFEGADESLRAFYLKAFKAALQSEGILLAASL